MKNKFLLPYLFLLISILIFPNYIQSEIQYKYHPKETVGKQLSESPPVEQGKKKKKKKTKRKYRLGLQKDKGKKNVKKGTILGFIAIGIPILLSMSGDAMMVVAGVSYILLLIMAVIGFKLYKQEANYTWRLIFSLILIVLGIVFILASIPTLLIGGWYDDFILFVIAAILMILGGIIMLISGILNLIKGKKDKQNGIGLEPYKREKKSKEKRAKRNLKLGFGFSIAGLALMFLALMVLLAALIFDTILIPLEFILAFLALSMSIFSIIISKILYGQEDKVNQRKRKLIYILSMLSFILLLGGLMYPLVSGIAFGLHSLIIFPGLGVLLCIAMIIMAIMNLLKIGQLK